MSKRSFLQRDGISDYELEGEEEGEEDMEDEEGEKLEYEDVDEEEEEVEEEEEEEEGERVERKKRIVVTVIIGGRKDGESHSPPPLRAHCCPYEQGYSPYDQGQQRGFAAASCQVDGCSADLVVAKRYHRRHKVCESHAKATVVLLCGVEQRFCQQCSRFHEILQFDGAKRSCRKRLAGHNERRRKVPVDPRGDHATEKTTVQS